MKQMIAREQEHGGKIPEKKSTLQRPGAGLAGRVRDGGWTLALSVLPSCKLWRLGFLRGDLIPHN